ncbi:YdcF family protein [Actinospica durhamensis]|uniref:YdcF family protein n=1 Tax=Actinospica durhamensis TaxID=1508375 RepID=A0A941EU37_9ACTN|nr:ElyC/SanA/YdcF family protein [Actinospica durhamensis]MBR7837051.1 YdcF family protein [Actinospica durhamensis]
MASREPRIARGIIVFGRGHAPGRTDRLSDAALARVDRLAQYLAEHAADFAEQRAVVVCSGGWAGAAGAVARRPADEECEGNLMAAAARTLTVEGRPLTRYADVRAEIESASTLENALRVHAGGFFAGMDFDARHPLGLVAHPGHVERAGYYCRKVFGLERAALLPLVATGGDQLSAGLPEPLMNLATRLACAGARRPEALRRRERMLIGLARALGRG